MHVVEECGCEIRKWVYNSHMDRDEESYDMIVMKGELCFTC